MLQKSSGNLFWLEFELLQAFSWLRHAVSMSHSTDGEDWLAQFATNKENIKRVKQVHGTTLHLASSEEREGDGLLTCTPNELLTIRHADCQAALFVDPVKRAIAAVHAGWRGQIAGMYEKTAYAMERHFGTSPSDLFVAIGPSLGPDSSEFIHYRVEIPESLWHYQRKPAYFDLWQLAEDQLLSIGIPKKQIEIARIDTAKESIFHSYRRDKNSLRQVTAAGISTPI